jgi:hypothetical protein
VRREFGGIDGLASADPRDGLEGARAQLLAERGCGGVGPGWHPEYFRCLDVQLCRDGLALARPNRYCHPPGGRDAVIGQ